MKNLFIPWCIIRILFVAIWLSPVFAGFPTGPRSVRTTGGGSSRMSSKVAFSIDSDPELSMIIPVILHLVSPLVSCRFNDMTSIVSNHAFFPNSNLLHQLIFISSRFRSFSTCPRPLINSAARGFHIPSKLSLCMRRQGFLSRL